VLVEQQFVTVCDEAGYDLVIDQWTKTKDIEQWTMTMDYDHGL
jgi:hypothetical protein